MGNHTLWRGIDMIVTGLIVGATAHWGNGWLALAVFAYGLWNYTDGLLRSKW